MDRRTFLRLFGAATVAVGVTAATPQVLQKVVELAAVEGQRVSMAEINALSIKHIMPGVVDQFFKSSPLLEYLKRNTVR
ncbi:hypothetical protein LCGC14_1846200 [marine sediment metagenome]|uniref:Uncharacterized protein n=1 Tax=marine sediment metagenome TaxID=412755 RepID=A0A0F9GBQ9_9ZZZZ